MFTECVRVGSDLEALPAAVGGLVARGAASVLVMAGVKTPGAADALSALARGAPAPVWGGLFPGLLHDGQRFDEGAVLIGLSDDAQFHTVAQGPAPALPPAAAAGLQGAGTLFVIFDAAAPAGPLIEALFDELGGEVAWVGGGAGAVDFLPRPVVLTPAGLVGGAAVVVGVPRRASVGVGHGWGAFGRTLRVTAAEGHALHSLDWQPALEVYREAIAAHSGQQLRDDNFSAVASQYPLIIERLGGEGAVRDPLHPLPGGGLRCAGDLRPHLTVRVAYGTPADTLAAARAARERAVAGGAPDGRVALTIDCTSRAMVLGERISDELEALRAPGQAQAGALTIGEVANLRGEMLQLHNKTAVIAVNGADGAPR